MATRRARLLPFLAVVLAVVLVMDFGCGADARPPKVVLLGLDGLTFDVLRPLIDAGRLPTFKRLI